MTGSSSSPTPNSSPKLRTAKDIATNFNTVTSVAEAKNLTRELTNKYRANSFFAYLKFPENSRVESILNRELIKVAQDLSTKIKIKLMQQIRGRHNFVSELNEYREFLRAQGKEEEFFSDLTATPTAQSYLEILKNSPDLFEGLANARFNQAFLFLLDMIINSSKTYQKVGNVQSREAQDSNYEEALKSTTGPSSTGTPSGTSGSTGTPSGTSSSTGTPSGTSSSTGTPSGTSSSTSTTSSGTNLAPFGTRHLFGKRALFRASALMTQFVATIKGDEPFELVNHTEGATHVTFSNSNNQELELLDNTTELAGKIFDNYAAVKAFIQSDIQLPTQLNDSIEAIYKATRGLQLEGVQSPLVPSNTVLQFFTRVACLPPKLKIKDNAGNPKQFSTTHLIALEYLKGSRPNNMGSLTYFMQHFNVTRPELQATIASLGTWKVITPRQKNTLQSKLNNLQINFKEIKQAETKALSQFINRGQLEKFQSSAGNILNDPSMLMLIGGVFGAGISAMNAFLQTAALIISNKGNILKNPNELWKMIMRYFIFKKLFNKAFSLLGGMPSMAAQEKSMVDKAIRTLNKITKIEDLFKDDRELPKETVYQFYRTHESSHKDFMLTDEFIRFMKNLFVDDNGNKQTADGGARVDAVYIKARITSHANTLSGAAKTKFQSKANSLFENATSVTGTEEFASMQFALLSLSLRAANITDPNKFKQSIKGHHR